ncbi:hypothetical protein [Lutibacter maritimus]|jgi:hypothetical protein|uniref:Uncharacterized protein n=1 Tax=Lutibacter maritimus TaxID=593133 RepID=A0A1I6NPY4_9FLAO|nr:hypothetical protein [Lutibacter maritimus]SFS29949.1 hypothetical protein SAMN04488006_0352 [Lutibacter maritimus]
MKTLENTYTSPERNFTVTEKDINNKNALLTHVLYNEMEDFVKSIITKHAYMAFPLPQLYKLQLLKNAFLNDKLLIKSQIIKYDASELHLLATVYNQAPELNETICKAVFKFPLNAAISNAS